MLAFVGQVTSEPRLQVLLLNEGRKVLFVVVAEELDFVARGRIETRAEHIPRVSKQPARIDDVRSSAAGPKSVLGKRKQLLERRYWHLTHAHIIKINNQEPLLDSAGHQAMIMAEVEHVDDHLWHQLQLLLRISLHHINIVVVHGSVLFVAPQHVNSTFVQHLVLLSRNCLLEFIVPLLVDSN